MKDTIEKYKQEVQTKISQDLEELKNIFDNSD
jgi:hypothetical protein